MVLLQDTMSKAMVTSTKVSLCFVVLVITLVKGEYLTQPSLAAMNHAMPGANVSFTCTASNSTRDSNVTLTYQWLLNDKVMPHEKNGTLLIYNVSSKDEGEYSCRLVDNDNRRSPSSAKQPFSLIVLPKVHIEQLMDEGVVQLEEGENLSLTCSLTNSPKPSLKGKLYWWTFLPMDGTAFTGMSTEADPAMDRRRASGKEVNLTSSSGGKPGTHLTLTSVKRSQSGRYTCHASNNPSTSQDVPSGRASVYVQIQYLDKPVRISPSTTQTVVEGDKVSLTCQVDSVPTANLTWLHQGRILRSVESNEDDFSFTATGCEDTTKEYQCRAENVALNKTVSNSVSIRVECPPTPVGSGSLSNVTEVSGREGENLTLSVNAFGIPPPMYTWSGPALTTLMTGQGSRSMTLKYLQPFHAGIYTVNVSNVHGSFLHTFHMTVLTGDYQRGVVEIDTESTVVLTAIGAFLLLLIVLCTFLFIRQRRRKQAKKRSGQTPEIGLLMATFMTRLRDSSRRRKKRRQDSSNARGTTSQELSDRVPTEHSDAGVRVVARFPYPRDGGESGETTAFVTPRLEPTVPKETGPAPPPYSPLSGIPMCIYPWVAMQQPGSLDTPSTEPEDKPSLGKTLHHPPRGGPTSGEEGPEETSQQPEAPPRPHFRTLAFLQEEERKGGELAHHVYGDFPKR